ncbi:transposase [Blautia sp. CAG:237]|uniref:transposase n=1 Tax=Blautia sp. CAG:237 TaxID=1262755 RepID=UPI0003359525|nr:transposase [Blautia sp. CAG:237]CDB78061.1 transposase [Blautia sp. CAG:237]
MVPCTVKPYRHGVFEKELVWGKGICPDMRKNWSGKKASAPTLEKRHRKYFLRFSYTEDVILTKAPVEEQIICGVDLGINTDAVCTIMRSDGTVLGRKFIDFSSEKDRMYRVLGRIKRFQRERLQEQSQNMQKRSMQM